MASDAVRLAETLKIEAGKIGAQAAGKSPDDLRKAAAAAAIAGKYDVAAHSPAAAVAAAPKDPVNWLAYADVAIKADDAQADNRWDLVTQGATAAYAAYQRAATPAAQAEALATLGGLLARHSAWRGALDAYKASLDRRDALDVRKTYEALREQYGFRILDYKVDNESTNPRVCFTFSEQLARKTDFAPYVAVSGASNTAISNEDQQICVEGLKHGERYAIVLRQGLPSAVGESLLKAADYEIYVRDRSPQAHFAGRAYVLPREGQEGAPLVTVNTAGSPSTSIASATATSVATVSRDDFLKPIDASRAQEIANQDGQKVWSGSMDVASDLNKDVVTEFPVLKAVGKLDPGVYLVTARPWKEETPQSDDSRTTRSSRRSGWSCPTSASPPFPATTACMRWSSRSAPPARSRGRTEAGGAQQRSAGGQDDRRRRAGRFRSGFGARQRRLGARAPRRDAGRRLQFPRPGAERLRSHRPRRRRPRRARRPRRLPLHRARRLSLGRDGVRDRAAARRQGRRPRRPAAHSGGQAPRRRRVQARDASPTRASAAAPSPFRCWPARLPANGRIEAYADPKGDPIGDGRVPARGLYPRAARLHAEAGQRLSSRPASRSRSRSTRDSSMARRRAASTSPARSAFRRSRAARSPAFPAMSRASPTTTSPRSRPSLPTR